MAISPTELKKLIETQHLQKYMALLEHFEETIDTHVQLTGRVHDVVYANLYGESQVEWLTAPDWENVVSKELITRYIQAGWDKEKTCFILQKDGLISASVSPMRPMGGGIKIRITYRLDDQKLTYDNPK